LLFRSASQEKIPVNKRFGGKVQRSVGVRVQAQLISACPWDEKRDQLLQLHDIDRQQQPNTCSHARKTVSEALSHINHIHGVTEQPSEA